MRKRILAFVLPMLATASISAARAGESVLVDHVPAGASAEVAMAIVKQACIGRGWKIEKTSPAEITASIAARYQIGRVTIRLSNGSLLYDGSAQTDHDRLPFDTSKGSHDLPSTWIENLRHDVALALAAIPDRTS